MKLFSKFVVLVLIVSLVVPVYSQEFDEDQEQEQAQEQEPAQESEPEQASEQPSGVNLKVGDNFFFEGNVNDNANDDKEESMAETQSTPFYKQTWFIATVAVVVIAGAAVGIYYGTRTGEDSGRTVEWENVK
jgi:flagellar basal body-associated protein FliL